VFLLKNSSSILYNIKFRKVLPYFVVPLLLYIFIVIIPLINSIYYSLNATFSYNLTWTGLNNYIMLIHDRIFWLSLKNNFYIILISLFFQIIPAFIIMVMIASRYVYKSKFVQSVFFFPCVISPLIIAYVWQIMYDTQTGLINKLLTAVGLGSLQQNWLSDPKIIMLSIAIPLAWQYIGYYIVILFAGFSNIDKDILEVAEIDGANGIKKAFYIILPLMKTTINVAVLICITGGIKIFDQIFALTGGGPGYASEVLSMYTYTISFSEGNYGYGSAISISMLLISLVIILIFSKVRGGIKLDV
jgi:raffinose/stachyose/melibiose transport system permease protein